MSELSYGFARRHRLLLTQQTDDYCEVLHSDRTSAAALQELRRYLNTPLRLQAIDDDQLESRINMAYQQQAEASFDAIDDISNEVDLAQLVEDIPDSQELLDSDDDAPVIRLINALFSEALKLGASDVHIETYETRMAVRLRVDGLLKEILQPSRKLAPLLVSRIKVMARLDIAEKRVPQDGRIALRLAGRAVDVRVSTIPSNYGERVVMRLLDKQAARLDLADLGMPDSVRHDFERLLKHPNGIILVTGPTGSGKTTTLYAGLTLLNDRSRNILTVEDPVEYDIEGIGQTQVNPKVGMSFAKGLRAILRQDPDVVMVGEIRDAETADIAVQASLTGHLVLSTLHTNNAVGAITRLIDIGIEPYLIASSLKGVLGQRLVRRLCSHCKQPAELDAVEAELLGESAISGRTVYLPQGCEQCQNTGFKGRIGLYELLVVDRRISLLIHDRAGEQAIEEAAEGRMSTLLAEGRRAVLAGQTSIDEVLRCVREDAVDAGL